MILRIIVFAFLLAPLHASKCGALEGSMTECVSHMMIAVDASSYLKDANKAMQAIDFISNNLMPKWGVSTKKTQFSYALYGLVDRTNLICKGYNTLGQSDPDSVCDALANVKQAWNRGVLAPASLFDIATDISDCTIKDETRVYDLVILFTANNQIDDIKNSAWLASQQPTVVVNLGNGDYSSWVNAKGATTTVLCNSQTFDDTLANRIVQAQCAKINGSDQCNVVQTTIPTFSSQVTGIPTVPDDQSTLCDCDISRSWNDIMILADASSAMGTDRFHELQNFVLSALAEATLGPDPYKTQVGVITYASQANVIANLDKYTNIDDFFNEDWGSVGGTDTNILAAVDIAIDQLESSRHRKKSRKVLIVGASTYREGNYEFPQNQTLTFKRNFGVIIVIGYGDIHGIGTEILQGMASPGMYIDATPGKSPDFRNLTTMICEANCFCPGQQEDGYFPVVRSGESWPSQGCYWDSTLTSIQPLVPRTCQQLVAASGVPAMPDTQLRQQTLIGGAATNLTRPSFFIGLQRQPNGSWQWSDGRPYQGTAPVGTGDCAVLRNPSGFVLNITAVDCHEAGYYYSCQTTPCKSTFYCE